MNNEQQKAKELAELLTAFADRKQLQYQMPIGYWVDYTNDATTEMICTTKYPIRIKPETKREPLTQQDLIDRINSHKPMYVKHGKAHRAIQDFNDETVFFFDDEFTYEQLMDLYEFADDTPCYKEVECE